jgi:ankyrin repeat protein
MKFIFSGIILLVGLVLLSPNSSYAQMDEVWFLDISREDYELLTATLEDDTSAISEMIDLGANVNVKTSDEVTPLLLAVQYGEYSTVKFLLEHEAKANSTDQNGLAPLHWAVIDSNLAVAELLIQHNALINLGDEYGRTPLYFSVLDDNLPAAELLMAYNADPNVATEDSIYPIHISVDNGFLPTFYLLLDYGADIHVQDEDGNTPLHIASVYGDTIMAEELLLFGANIEKENKKGYTPLALAVENNQLPYIRFLDKFYHPDFKVKLGIAKNLRTIARSTRNPDLINYIESKGVIKNHYPYFNKVIIGFDQVFNGNDYLFEFSLGMHETKYNMNVNLGWMFRPSYHKILIPVNESLQYQYFEKIRALQIDLEKRFAIHRFHNDEFGFNTSLQGYYLGGKYRGTSTDPVLELEGGFTAGMYFRFNAFELSGYYKYFDIDRPGYNPNMAGINVNIYITYR